MPAQLTITDVRGWVAVILIIGEAGLTVLEYRRQRRWWWFYVPQVIVFLLAGAAAGVRTAPSAWSWTLSAAGLALFAQGFMLRHVTRLPSIYWLGRARRVSRPFGWPAAVLFLGSRHPEPIALVLETLGMAILSASEAVVLVGTVVQLAATPLVIRSADEKRFVRSDLPYFERDGVRQSPGWQPLAFITIVSLVVAAIVGVISQELPIFYGDSQTATAMLATVSQVVGTIGVLAITISFIVAQVVASEVSLRSSLTLARHPYFLWTAALVALSLGVSLTLLSRTGALAYGTATTWRSGDVALLLGGAAIVTTGWFVFQAPWLLNPERIVDLELRRFDQAWAAQVLEDWGGGGWRPRTLWTYRDPLVVVSSLISKAIERRDGLTLQTTLLQVQERLLAMFAPDPDRDVPTPDGRHEFERGAQPAAIPLDSYLTDRFGDALQLAAESKFSFALQQFLQFRDAIGAPRPAEQLDAIRGFAAGLPEEEEGTPGERFIRGVIEKSIDVRLPEPATEGLHLMSRYREVLQKYLPPGSDTYFVRTSAVSRESATYDDEEAALSEQDRERHRKNDERVRNFHDNYTGYYRDVAMKAIDRQLWALARTALFQLEWELRSFFDRDADDALRKDALLQVLLAVYQVSDHACHIPHDQKRAVQQEFLFSLHGLHSVAEKLSPSTDAFVADLMSRRLADMLVAQYYAGVLGSSFIESVARVGASFAGRFSDAEYGLVDTFAVLAARIAERGWTPAEPDRRTLYMSLVGALRKQYPSNSQKWSEPGMQAMRTKVKALLEELGEKEFVRWDESWTAPERPPRRPIDRAHLSQNRFWKRGIALLRRIRKDQP